MGVKQARAREDRVERVAERARRELLATLEELEARRRRAMGWPRATLASPGTQAAAGVTGLAVLGAAAAVGWWRLGRGRGGVRARLSPALRSTVAHVVAEVARRAVLSFVAAWVGARARRVGRPRVAVRASSPVPV
jgi:hypothetical protein